MRDDGRNRRFLRQGSNVLCIFSDITDESESEQTGAGLVKPCPRKTNSVPCRPAVDLLEEIKMLNKSFKLNDNRVQDANQALEDSMDTRQKAKHKLSMCSGKGDLAPLEKETEDLNATNLNRKVGSCHMTCSEARNSRSARPLISSRTTRPKRSSMLPVRAKIRHILNVAKNHILPRDPSVGLDITQCIH